MKNDRNLLVTVSSRNNRGRVQVFATNFGDGFVFGVKNFQNRKDAMQYANDMAYRWSCRIEQK